MGSFLSVDFSAQWLHTLHRNRRIDHLLPPHSHMPGMSPQHICPGEIYQYYHRLIRSIVEWFSAQKSLHLIVLENSLELTIYAFDH